MAVAEKEVGKMLHEALKRSEVPPKALAMDCGCSVDAIYAAEKGKRRLPRGAQQTIAKTHIVGGLAAAYEATGYTWFLFDDCDRHPQNLLQRNLKEDKEADEVLAELGFRLIDKQTRADLTDVDILFLRCVGKELSDRVKSDINLLIELEDRYQIGLLDYLLQKEKDRS